MNLFTSTFFNSGDSVVDNYPDATIVEVDTNLGSAGFILTQSNYDMITVDWGDGNIETYEGSYSNNEFDHSYEESKKYIIQIQGDSIEQIKFTYLAGSVIRAIKCGSTLTSHEDMFNGCSNLAKVEKIFKIGSNSSSQAWMFYHCSSLTEITHNLFPNNGIVLYAPYMFSYSGLTVVKNLAIPGAAIGHFLEAMFQNCNLFSFDFDSFFKNDSWTADGQYMFQNNTTWSDEIPSQYFWDSNYWGSTNSMFSNCYYLDNYDSIPSDWK